MYNKTEFMKLFDDILTHYNMTERDIDRYLQTTFKNEQPRFEKVSFAQFTNDWLKTFPDDWYGNNKDDIHDIKTMYDTLTLPSRSTAHSAGYDFVSPMNFMLKPDETIMIPTGIRAYMPHDMVLMVFPRSGLGTKYQIGLCNTVGIVDADYYDADNEGHIMLKLANRGDNTVSIEQGQAFAQGIFLNYHTTYGDDVTTGRTGGFGSTDKKR